MHKHKVLLLGLGFWGTNWMRILERAGYCEIAGISGCDEDIAKASMEFGMTCNSYTDYREAIEKTDADISVIVIPTRYHIDAARHALERGMHVLSEKPLALNMAEADEALAFKAKYPHLKYMVNQNYRWRPHIQTMKKALEGGMIGDIGSVHVEFRRPEDLIGYRVDLEMPVLQDVSIHHFDLVRFLTGRNAEEIFAYSFRPSWSEFRGKSASDVVIRMQGGIVVNYNATWAARGKITSWDGNITISGDRGCLTLDPLDTVKFFGPDDTAGTVLRNMGVKLTELDYALDMFVRCIENNETPETTLEDNYHSFAMVCTAEESAIRNVPITL